MEAKITGLKKVLGIFVVTAMYVIMTFYLNDAYFNALESKAVGVMALFIIFNVLSAVLTCILFVKVKASDYLKNVFDNFAIYDHAIVIFGLIAILSNFLSTYMRESFYGSYGWLIGTLFIILAITAYLFLSANIEYSPTVLIAIAATISIESLWIFLNFLKIDPFYFHRYLAEEDIVRYVGSIGNVNWYVGYMALSLPILFTMSIVVRNIYAKTALIVGLTITFWTAFTCNSDGAFIALFFIMGGFVFYGLSDKKLLFSVFVRMAIMYGSLGILEGVYRFANHTALDGYAGIILENHVYIIPFIMVSIFAVIVGMLNNDVFKNISGRARMVFLALIILAAIALFLSQVPKFSDSYGHNRGRTWRVAFETFKGLPFIRKLFGTGLSTFGHYYADITGSQWVRNAHNEYIEYMITTGIAGIAALLLAAISVLVTGIRNIMRANNTMPFIINATCFISLTAYMGQAFVNNPQGLNIGILVVVLAFFKWSCFTIKSELVQREKKSLKEE